MLKASTLIVAIMALGAVATAQPADRDHHDHDRGPPEVRDIEPASGPVGTTVTIHGHDIPAGATVMIGKQHITSAAAGAHAWTFTVPATLHPGAHPIEIEVAGKVTPVGTFEVTAAAEPPPPPPAMGGEAHHHDWKLDRPVVSSYWPTKGKVGSHVRIRGENFPADAMVLWNDTQVTGAKVTPTEIELAVPAGSTGTGMIAIQHPGGRPLPVGQFEVTTFDAAAEWKHEEDERKKAAEAAWAARSKEIAKDKAAREAAFAAAEADLDKTREQRRAARLAELRGKWEAAFLADPETQAELTLHGQRLADLARMKEIAEEQDNGKLAVRIGVALDHENQRHDQRMAALKAAFHK